MVDTDDNIPTLTNIVHPGDESMLNHFDAHELDSSAPPELDTATDADTDINDDVESVIPSISIHEEKQTSLPDDFTDAFSESIPLTIPLDSNTPSMSASDDLDITNLDLKESIDQAVSDLLPNIEKLLKEKLYTQFKL